MGKFITLREEFESDVGEYSDKGYIEWLERVVEGREDCSSLDVVVKKEDYEKALATVQAYNEQLNLHIVSNCTCCVCTEKKYGSCGC